LRSFYADFYFEIRGFQGWICDCLQTLSILAKYTSITFCNLTTFLLFLISVIYDRDVQIYRQELNPEKIKMYPSFQKLAVALILVTFAVLNPGISIAQEKTTAPAGTSVSNGATESVGRLSIDDLKAKRAAVETSEDLEESVKNSALSILDRAILFAEEKITLETSTEKISQMVQTAPKRIKEVEDELNRPPPETQSIETAASQMTWNQIQQHVMKLDADLAAATATLNQLTTQVQEYVDRPDQLRQEIAGAKKRLIEIEQELRSVPSPDKPQLLIDARRLALLSEQDKFQTQITSYEQQLVNLDALIALNTAERDLATRNVAQLQALFDKWQAHVQRARKLAARKDVVEAKQAKKLAVGLPPVIQEQFDVNIKLGKRLRKVIAGDSKLTKELQQKKAQLKQIEEDFSLARERVKFSFRTEIIGQSLLEQRRSLPNIINYRRDSAKRQELMGAIRSRLIKLDRMRQELADLDLATSRIIETLDPLPESEINALTIELRKLLSDRRELVKKSQAAYLRYLKTIESFEFIEQEIVNKAQEQARFLDGHLLWIRSTKTFGPNDVQNLPQALKWMIGYQNWSKVAQNWVSSLTSDPLWWIMGFLIALATLGSRRWARRDLSRIARAVYSVKTDTFLLTFQGLILTSVLALGWPFLMGFTGWQLGRLQTAEEIEFTQAVSNGLLYAAYVFVMFSFTRNLCRNDGIAKVHFKWPESVRRTLRRSLSWLMLLTIPLSFVIHVTASKNDAMFTDSLGRLAFLVVMIGFSVFTAYGLRFSGPIMANLIHSRREGWLVRLRFIWYPLAVGLPLLLALLAGTGFYYSALALEQRVGETIMLILGLVIINGLLLRWLYITQRRLAFQETQRKKEVEKAQNDPASQADKTEGEPMVIEEPEIQLAEIAEKNRTLLRNVMFFSALFGFWVIWDEVMPAFDYFRNVALWTYSSEVEGVIKVVPITLADFILAVIIAMLTIVTAKNLPGLLEMILLRRLPMDRGSRNAITTIFSYAITALGIIVAFTAIGIKWSSLQWLVAALGVGIGFGLQEIVANFICGLIVLFERPYRVGDTVTIGDVTGTVTRIRIRATTVMDWDRKELIVPNKEFITGRLVNWSLSDNIVRIRIPVGIAYGSDTELAEKLMLKAADENSIVLKKPQPQAIFLGFGDNSLNFEIRVFINGMDDWIPMLHKLNQAVDREFRKAGVSISFPQRDVHLDQIGPLEVRVVSDQGLRHGVTS